MRTLPCFLGAFVLLACGGGDPGGAGAPQDDAGASDASSSPAPVDAEPPSVDAKAPPSRDAGTPGSSVNDPIVPGVHVTNPTDAFSGAGSYAPSPPTLRANDQHAGGAVVTGQPCLSCHDGTTCVKFDFAGTVWMAPALTQGAPDVNVRIIDANDYAYSVYSDVDGNFWHRADSDLVLPALSGVRTANFKAVGMLNGVSCNTCHYAGNTGPNAPPGPRLFVQAH